VYIDTLKSTFVMSLKSYCYGKFFKVVDFLLNIVVRYDGLVLVYNISFFLQQCLHSELVSCVGWTSPEEVYSAGDDHQILRWNLLTNESSLVVKLNDDVYPTDMQWFPKSGASKKGSASDVFALSSTDGQLQFCSCWL